MFQLISIRYNYKPEAGLLEVCMPTKTHDLFTIHIVKEIESYIHQFSTQCAPFVLPAFLDVIENESTNDIFGSDDYKHKRSLDAAFSHPNDQYPRIVIEISYILWKVKLWQYFAYFSVHFP